MDDECKKNLTFYSCKWSFQFTGQLRHWKQRHAVTGLTFRGRQTSPFRLLSIFPAETEVDFSGVLFHAAYLTLGENRSCPKSLKSGHTNNPDTLYECSAAIQRATGSQQLRLIKTILLITLPFFQRDTYKESPFLYEIFHSSSEEDRFFYWGRASLLQLFSDVTARASQRLFGSDWNNAELEDASSH